VLIGKQALTLIKTTMEQKTMHGLPNKFGITNG